MSLVEAMKALGQPLDTACRLIERLLGKPFEVGGEIVTDQLRFLQWKNRTSIICKVDTEIERRGLQKRELSPEFLLPFIRECGDISSESLQDTWARLLASAVESELNEHIAFINLLKNMSAADVQVLDCMIRLGYLPRDDRPGEIAASTGLSVERVQLSIANLDHLGFFSATQKRLKKFGIAFLRSCISESDALDRYLETQDSQGRNLVSD